MNRDIDFLRVVYLAGPNMWTYKPVIEACIDIGEFEERPSHKIDGLYHRLTSCLPGLVEHRCGLGVRGGFLERLQEGTWIGHILEHVALELQNLAGMLLGFGQTRSTQQKGIYKLVFRTDNEQVGRLALEMARDLLMAMVYDDSYDLDSNIARLKHLVDSLRLDYSSTQIIKACAKRGIPWFRFAESPLVQLGYGARQRRIWHSITDQASAIAVDINADKALTKTLLAKVGLAVPCGQFVYDAEEAWLAAEQLTTPLIVRAVDADYRQAVILERCVQDAVMAAYNDIVDATNDDIVVEELLPGQHYRFLLLNQSVIALQIVAEGIALARDEFDFKLHPSIEQMLALATRVLDLDIASIDLIAADLSQAKEVQRLAIIDVNAKPNLALFIEPSAQEPSFVAERMSHYLFSKAESARVPIVTVLGESAEFISKLMAAVLASNQSHVGLACQDGVFLGGRQISKQNAVRYAAGHQLLMNPLLEAAVIECDAEMILNQGLAFDRSDLAILTDFTLSESLSDYYVNDTAALSKVLRTLVDVVLPEGAAVLNADDVNLLKMAEHCDGAVVLFATSPHVEAIRSHRAKGYHCVFLSHQQIIIAEGTHETVLLSLDSLNISCLTQIRAILAVVAAATALHIKTDVLIQCLLTFDFMQ